MLTSSYRPIILSVMVLITLIVAVYILKNKAKQASISVDTLKVTSERLILNNREIKLGDLEKIYPEDGKLKRLHVWYDPAMEWGQSWEIEDTLRKLLQVRKDLKITGLLDVR